MGSVARVVRSGVLVVGAALMAGCYTYAPVEQPTPGSTVRVHVPVVSALRQANGGPGETASVEGTLLAWGDSVVLESTNVVLLGAYREITRVDTVRLARENVSLVEAQELSKPRTVGLTATLVIGTLFLAATGLSLTGGGGGDENKGGGGDPTTGQLFPGGLLDLVFRLTGR